MTDLYDRLEEASTAVRGRTEIQPRFGIVLGSWLGGVADEVEGVRIPYAEIPHVALPTTPEQRPQLLLGTLAGQPVAVFSSRVHLYEGASAQEVVFPVQLLRRLGVETLILTNSSGSLTPEMPVGSLMLIEDQINLTGQSPLVGTNDVRLGPRYPDLSELYGAEIRTRARSVAQELGILVGEGVYLGILGPNFQTRAEVRMARLLGADAVGMSTVLEAIAAAHAGLEILGISAITDIATGRPPEVEEVGAVEIAKRLASLLRGLLAASPRRRSSPLEQLMRQAPRRK